LFKWLIAASVRNTLLGLAKVLCAYQGVPAPQNGCPALLLKVDDVVDILCSDDDFWWEVSTAALFSAIIIWETGDTQTVN